MVGWVKRLGGSDLSPNAARNGWAEREPLTASADPPDNANPLFIGISKSDSNRINKLQRRFHRLLCGPECKDYCLPSLDERRENQALKLCKDSLCSTHILYEISCRVSQSGRLISPRCRTARRSNSFVEMTARLFNSNFRRWLHIFPCTFYSFLLIELDIKWHV